MAKVQIEGLKQLQRTLKAIAPELQQEVKSLNLEAAQTVASAARPPVQSGRLANSVRPGASLRSGIVRAGNKSVPYAGAIHFGWAKHGIAPNPFLYKALDSRRDEVLSRYADGLSKVIDKLP